MVQERVVFKSWIKPLSWFFNAFFGLKGISKMHKDKNDKLSCLFMIHSPSGSGKLDIGGQSYAVKWDAGDVIILDSSSFLHGA